MSLFKLLVPTLVLGSLAVAPALAGQGAAAAGVFGSDSAACTNGEGPAIRANIEGLKDRTGELKLELYPANETDFLQADWQLQREGKFFRRVRITTPVAGPVAICIRVPVPGRYALLFTHNRDGKNKFDFWSDGAGFPSNVKLGRQRPKLAMATLTVGAGVTAVDIKAQYLRGLSGFAPLRSDG